MRILFDESVPWKLARLLPGHECQSVQRRGWAGTKNGRLLALAAAEFDVLLTADRGMQYQQNPNTLPVAVLLLTTRSNRMHDIAPGAARILAALADLRERAFHTVDLRESTPRP